MIVRWLWQIGKWTFVLLCLLAVIFVLETIFVGGSTHQSIGCRQNNAIGIAEVKCTGFPGAASLGFALSLPSYFWLAKTLTMNFLGNGLHFDNPKLNISLALIDAWLILGAIWPFWWLTRKATAFKNRRKAN